MAGESTATGAALGTAISPGIGTVIGAGAGLIGDIFGGFFGDRSSKRQLAESKRQFNMQYDFQRNHTQYRVQDALKAGINPLAALGVSSNVSPTVSTYGGDNAVGNAVSRAGDRVGRMFERLSQQDTLDDMNYRKQSRALDLESKRIQNDIDKARLGAMGQPGVPEPSGDPLLFRPAYDINGRPRLLVNQDVTENDSDNAAYLSAIASAYLNGGIEKSTGRVRSAQHRMMYDDMYFRSTGRHISNLEDLYISPTEMGIITALGAKELGELASGIISRGLTRKIKRLRDGR